MKYTKDMESENESWHQSLRRGYRGMRIISNEDGKESIRKNTEKSADEEMQRRLNSNNPMNHEERTE